MDREEHIYQEAAALWQALFDSPPPPLDGPALLGLIVSRSPDTTAYQRLHSPYLRPSTISGPRR